MKSDNWISRKEIAYLTGLSVDTIRRSENHIGILKYKVCINPRVVVYHRLQTLAILEAKELLSLRK